MGAFKIEVNAHNDKTGESVYVEVTDDTFGPISETAVTTAVVAALAAARTVNANA